jgi:hypothetical protein
MVGWIPHHSDNLQGLRWQHTVASAHEDKLHRLELDHEGQDAAGDTCVLAKQQRLPLPHQASFSAKEKVELVHGNLYGPVTRATHGGWRYFLLLVDYVSRYM